MSAEPALDLNKLFGKSTGFKVRIVLAVAQPDADRLAAGSLLKEGRGPLKQVFRSPALIHHREEVDGDLTLLLDALGLGDIA